LAALIGMPESIKYMALHKSQRRSLQKLVADIRPDFEVPANARFVVEDERQFPGFNPIYLFRDGLAVITPLLWLLFALNLMGYFFLASWTPTLLAAAQLPPTTAALAGATLQVGGTVGALTLCRWLGRHRFLAVTILFVIATTIGAMPPIKNRICQPYRGTKVAATNPGIAPPTGTQPTATSANVARRLRGADSTLMATTFGITPPMPTPASNRNQNIDLRLVA
jgi:hypothetical protein